MTRKPTPSNSSLAFNRGPYVEQWQRTYDKTRSQKHYAKLREALHLKIQQDNERAAQK